MQSDAAVFLKKCVFVPVPKETHHSVSVLLVPTAQHAVRGQLRKTCTSLPRKKDPWQFIPNDSQI